MGNKSYKDTEAKCPYYKYSKGRDIACEGCMKAICSILRFASGSKMQAHKEQYCDNQYKDCNVYQLKEDEYDKQIQSTKNNSRWDRIRQ